MKACKNCKYIVTNEKKCPVCGNESFTEKFSGMVYIFDLESYIAKKLNVKKTGPYAISLKNKI